MSQKIPHKILLFSFTLCTRFLSLLGKCMGLNYKQISVIFNLYLQGGLLAVSGTLPLGAAIWRVATNPHWHGWLLLFLCAVYLSIYIAGFITIIRHYHLPMESAFDLCVKDLLWIAEKWHMSYHAVNIVIFVFWWLSVIGMNIYISYCIITSHYTFGQ